MITEHDLQEAIAECEGQRNPTANTCMKLAAFYAIKDKMYPDPDTEVRSEPESVYYSRAMGPVLDGKVEDASDTEFGRVIAGMNVKNLIPIMDELMSTLQVVSPRIYAGVMRKLSEV